MLTLLFVHDVIFDGDSPPLAGNNPGLIVKVYLIFFFLRPLFSFCRQNSLNYYQIMPIYSIDGVAQFRANCDCSIRDLGDTAVHCLTILCVDIAPGCGKADRLKSRVTYLKRVSCLDFLLYSL